MSESYRTQLTLFVNSPESQIIDKIRERYNPIQYSLIKPHITLCREEEIINIEKVTKNLENLKFEAFSLELGKPTRFNDANGLYLPIVGNSEKYFQLRKLILNEVFETISNPLPHITIMHPKNSSCSNEIFNQIISFNIPQLVNFSCVSLITQRNNEKWITVKEFHLLS